jgi:phosphoribosylformylglycinamidine cyclo-ligase
VDIMEACTNGTLSACEVVWKDQASVCVVAASEKYPECTSPAQIMTGLSQHLDNTLVFHAGTKETKQGIFADGGRIVGVTAWADTLEAAVMKAYQRMDKISFKGMQYRKDIGRNFTDAYARAGVDIAAGNRTVSLMTQAVRSTYGKEVLAGIGAFGGMYHAAAIKQMNDPVLVASTDGIGTKVHLAAAANRWQSLGHDIVHHSVNDILVQGAKPLFFLDYLASSKLEPDKMAAIVMGMAEACRASRCALLGGETAEMPGVYMPGMCDVAGTIVGIVERHASLPRADLKSGDILLGVASSGPHTNGYSLIRKIFAETSLDTVLPGLKVSLADALLAPHRNYLPVLEAALHHPLSPVKGLVHITGGGFFENIPRILPEGLGAVLQKWPVPALFQQIQQQGNVDEEQMYHIFNMGIGMIIITASENIALLESVIDEPLLRIGSLVSGEKRVRFE